MSKRLFDSDADPSLITNTTVAVIGYGNQGRAQAQNLRDSGIRVVIGAREGGGSERSAAQDGFEVLPIRNAAGNAEFVLLATPDGVMPQVYEDSIAGYIRPGSILLFAHGFNIHYGAISPDASLDVGMVSPKGQAIGVRQSYLDGSGLPALIAVAQDATGTAWQRVIAYAWAIGCLRTYAVRTSFRDETECDLFGEQAVLCGGIPELIRAGYETLVEAGYSPEVAYFECLFEAKLIVDLIVERGLAGMRAAISDTAAWGGLSVGRRLIDEDIRVRLREALADIQSGKFANDWIAEVAAGSPTFRQYRAEEANSDIERTGDRLKMETLQK